MLKEQPHIKLGPGGDYVEEITLACGRSKFVILAPGSSIALYKPDEHADATIIGVNRIVAFHEVDYWVTSDIIAIEGVFAEGGSKNPKAIMVTGKLDSRNPEVAALIKRHRDSGGGYTSCRQAWYKLPKPLWVKCNWSVVVALGVAYSLGGIDIQCYGMDWSGKSDWDYAQSGFSEAQRKDGRWAKEAADWQAAVDWIGITIKRHLLP